MPWVWVSTLTVEEVFTPTLSKLICPPSTATVGKVKVPLMMPVPPSPTSVPPPVMAELDPKTCLPQLHKSMRAPAETLNVPVLLPVPKRRVPFCTFIVPLFVKDVKKEILVSPELVLVIAPKLLNVPENMSRLFWMPNVAPTWLFNVAPLMFIEPLPLVQVPVPKLLITRPLSALTGPVTLNCPPAGTSVCPVPVCCEPPPQ